MSNVYPGTGGGGDSVIPSGATIVAASGGDYTSLTEALAAASSGDVIVAYPGNYAENITIPDGVRLVGYPAAQQVIISGTGTGSRVTFAGGGTFRECTVVGPASGSPAITTSGQPSGKIAVMHGVVPQGGGGSGSLVDASGSGILAITDGLYHNGGTTTGAVLSVSAGSVFAIGPLVGNVGSAADFIRVSGGSLIAQVITCQSSTLYTATDGLDVSGGTVNIGQILTPSASPFTNAIHITGNGCAVTVGGNPIQSGTYDLLVGAALAGTGTTLNISAEMSFSKTSWPSGYRNTADTKFNFGTETGWAVYRDTTHTSGSPQTFTDGTRTIWSNNAGSSDEDYRPGSAALWSSNAIQPPVAGQAYTLRIDFTYQPAGVNTSIDFELDIGSNPTGGSSIPIVRRTITAAKGTSVQYASIGFPIFCLSTFVANGGTILLTAQGNNVDVYDKVITLIRIY